MADRIPVKTVDIGRDIEAYEYRGEDGYPAGACFSPVCVETEDGRKFFLPIGQRGTTEEEGFTYYAERYDADEMMAWVQRVGTIDPDKWIPLPDFDIEAELGAFGNEWEREQQDRMQWGAAGY